ncbi:MAG: DUF898 family protein [Burkholderiales bacterium]|nr:DUF898 family protein [Burkholderiales bacterium]MBH2016571.1 DUF898 family protein [Burkholderiales bacterium]
MNTPSVRSATRRGLPRLPGGAVDTWPVQFSGDADDYAAIWLQGAILSLLSLGLYLPWARLRCRRYLLQHTRVAGQSVDDHGSPLPMLVRQLLACSLAGAVALAAQGSPLMGLLALTLGLLSWPLLWLAGVSHRANRLSWGNRPLGLQGCVAGVYRAWGPPLLAVTGLLWSAWGLHRVGVGVGPAAWAVWGLAGGLCALSVPPAVWRLWHWRQSHARLGPLRLRWQASRRSVWALCCQVLARGALMGLMWLGLLALALAGARLSGGAVPLTWVWVAAALAAVLLALLQWWQWQARRFRLVWDQTGNRCLRFRCTLSPSALTGMHLRHAVLVLCTAGVYWPWAQIESWQAHAGATVLRSRVSVRTLTRHWPARRSALG